MNMFDKIYDLVASVPKGRVTTYGVLAKLVGTDPRVIGYALHQNKDSKNVPCHRVINSKGKISQGSDTATQTVIVNLYSISLTGSAKY